MPENTNPKIEDHKSLEEKSKDFVVKIKPYKEKLWAARKKFLIVNFIVLILAVVYLLFLTKPYFKSTVTILPEYGSKHSSMLNQFSGLASIVGVNVGEASPTEIYQKLISSETVLHNVIYDKYLTQRFPDSVNLIKYFEIKVKEEDPGLKKRKEFLLTYDILVKSIIRAYVERMTKILDVTVTMPEAELSADVVNNLVKSLDRYVRTQRKSYATEQSFYLEKRTKQIKDSLNIAENALKNFREQNRITSQSPNLLLEQSRLMRNVEILQTVYIELTKQLEVAKIDEIKDAPVLNVEEYAKSPVQKAGPNRTRSLILIMFLSVLLSGAYFLYKDNFIKYFKILRG